MAERENPNKSDRLPNGYFAKGNQIGRMPKNGFTLTDLNKLVAVIEKNKDSPLLQHYIDELYKDNRLLDKYIERNVPTKTINELTGNISFVIEKIDYTKGIDDNKS